MNSLDYFFCSVNREILAMARYASLLIVDLPQMYQSKCGDARPHSYLETDINATGEFFFCVQSTVTFSPWPNMHYCFLQIFPRCIYGASLKTLSLMAT